MCEPNFYLPQSVSNIFKIETNQVEKKEDKSDEANNHGVEYETHYYRVLPLLSHKNGHHKEVLSLKENEYLRLRWQKFLSKMPSEYIRIRLYTEQKKSPLTPRRMTLNGCFYGVDNKLSPVPIIPDPRMTEKNNSK